MSGGECCECFGCCFLESERSRWPVISLGIVLDECREDAVNPSAGCCEFWRILGCCCEFVFEIQEGDELNRCVALNGEPLLGSASVEILLVYPLRIFIERDDAFLSLLGLCNRIKESICDYNILVRLSNKRCCVWFVCW